MHCGYRFPWLTLSLEAMVLADTLLKVKHQKPRQGLLFPMDMDMRKRFGDLGTTLWVVMKKNRYSRESVDWTLDFLRYEMFGFVQSRWTDEQLEPVIDQLLAVSRAEPLSDSKVALEFLYQLQNAALAKENEGRCF